jgi:hypothetical protein
MVEGPLNITINIVISPLLQLDGASREVDEGASFLDSVGEEVSCLGSTEGEEVIMEAGSVVEEGLHETNFLLHLVTDGVG